MANRNKNKGKLFNTAENRKESYDNYVVQEESTLLDWLLANLSESRTKIKATLKGRGIKVNGKQITRHDFPLVPGMKISVSKTKRNNTLRSRYVKLSMRMPTSLLWRRTLGFCRCLPGTIRSM